MLVGAEVPRAGVARPQGCEGSDLRGQQRWVRFAGVSLSGLIAAVVGAVMVRKPSPSHDTGWLFRVFECGGECLSVFRVGDLRPPAGQGSGALRREAAPGQGNEIQAYEMRIRIRIL